jgi:hypothetical protein
MRKSILLMCFVVCSLGSRATAQTLTAGNVSATITKISTDTGRGVENDWRALSGNAKTVALQNYLNATLQVRSSVNVGGGFAVNETITFQRANSPAASNQTFRLTFIPITFATPSRQYPRASAAILLCRCITTPGLDYPRKQSRNDRGVQFSTRSASDENDRQVW